MNESNTASAASRLPAPLDRGPTQPAVPGGELQAMKPSPGGHDGQDRLLLTVNEAASLLGCHKVTVYRLIYQGRLRVCRAFRSLRIPRKEVERLVADVEPYRDAR